MLVFTQNLNKSLGRAIALAEQQSYASATPEHVLLALLDDPEIIPVMQACNVDLEKLRSAVLTSMPHSDDTSNADEMVPVGHFQGDLQRAIAHARSSGCDEVNSTDVLVAMLDGPAAGLMNEHGITRYDATTFICHGISKDAQATSRPGHGVDQSAANALSGATAGSSMSGVQLLNDNYTPMDFVVSVLEQVFELEQEDAERIMFEIHRNGVGAFGTFTREEAEARAAQVMELARQHQHPLRCCVQE